MIPPEVSTLRDILLNDPNVTNSVTQATSWAHRIIEKMYQAGYMIERIDASADHHDPHDELIKSLADSHQ